MKVVLILLNHVGKVVVFLGIFRKKYGTDLLVQKLWRKKSCQNPISAILRLKKQVPMAIKLEGGGLMPWPLVEELFLVLEKV